MLSMKSVLASDPVLALFWFVLYPSRVSVCLCLFLLPSWCVFLLLSVSFCISVSQSVSVSVCYQISVSFALSLSFSLSLCVSLSLCCGLFHCLSALSVCIQPHTHRREMQDAQSPASEKSNLCVNCPDSSPIFFSLQCQSR